MAAQPPNLTLPVASLVAGVFSHALYFNRGEHHLWGLRYLQMFLVACFTAIALLVRAYDTPLNYALKTVGSYTGLWLTGVLSSLLVYRIFLNPLNKFPGPFMGRITQFWYTSKVAGNAQAHKLMLKMHEKYGPFVHISPSDLSIAHRDGPKAIYGLGTKCYKGAWYDNDTPHTSMHTSRDRQMHDARRRIWSPAFSDKALRGYEDRIRPYGDKLVKELNAFGGKPVNVSDWFNYYSFDVMGDLAFGESFDMLEKGEEHWAIGLLNAGMEPLHLMLPGWFFRVLTAIPGAAKDYWNFIAFCSQKLEERWAKDQSTPDIMSVLLDPYRKTGKPTGRELTYLQGDSRLIIVAGSDTTAATLTHMFYLLAKNPAYQRQLRDELAPYMDADGDVKNRDIQDAPLLNGTINEALRLFPPVPTMIPRITPPEGITIDGKHIPGGMNVWCPQYVIGRSEDAYPDPYKFYPERWSSDPSGVVEKTSFAPFSHGVYGCIGKPLALIELRTVATKLLMNYNVDLAPGDDGSNLTERSRDHFTTGLGDLKLTFNKRS